MKKIVEFAPAKLNLFLDVTGRRENGYHEIDSIMQTVSLCDEINIFIDSGEGIEVVCNSPFAPSGKENIIWRAADKYLSENKINASLKLELVKNIPSPAGMGGGSADAAAVLRGLNRHFRAMNDGQLVDLAIGVGSDVPFCLRGGTQRVRGLGERIDRVYDLIGDGIFLIAVSGEDVPTPKAYKSLDERFDSFREYHTSHTPDRMIEAIGSYDLKTVCGEMYNIFEDVVLPHCPLAANAKRIMLENGALGAMMSGSGATVFGIFDRDDEGRAIYAKETLENAGVKAYIEFAYSGKPPHLNLKNKIGDCII